MTRHFLRIFVGLFCTCVSLQLLAAAKTHEFKLDNGMKVIIKEDHRAPVVVSQVWYKVGASYEYDGITGISHVLEHMMFKGTKKLGPNEFSKIISRNGGRENAFTSQDYTAYFQQLEKSRLEVSFKHEADRMRNLTLPEKEFKKEIEVVKEERRLRTEDKPESSLYERFISTAYQTSPYRMPTIGWMSDLENMNVKDLRFWYDRYYAPNNAILVVVGDVNPKAVLALAKKHFGPLKPSEIPKDKPRPEVEQVGTKRIVVKLPAKLPYLMMGYKVPVVKTAKQDWEPYALEVMAWILDGGRSARFSSELVRGKQIASSASTHYDPFDRLQTLFLVYGRPSQGKTVTDLEKEFRDQLNKLKTTLVTQKELDRIKAQVVAQNVYQRDSFFYKAMTIGQLEAVGYGWKLGDKFVENVNKVTAKQIMAVAKKYLVDNRLTVATLDPLPLSMKKKRVRPAIKGGRHGH